MSTTEDMQARVADYEILCHRCRLGDYSNCERTWNTESDCPGDGPSAAEYLSAVRYLELSSSGAKKSEGKSSDGDIQAPERPERTRGDSGYIHPDAWPSEQNIGGLADPESTGRKRVVKMYPIQPGQVCEWAKLKGGLGGSPIEIIGCINNPATDQHHGPDKNTLNNEKGSLGVGINDNVHLICSSCHNKAHAIIDITYPPYDRIAEQERPWLPNYSQYGPPLPVVPASIDELLAEERRRLEEEAKRGKTKRGRAKDSIAPDTEIMEED